MIPLPPRPCPICQNIFTPQVPHQEYDRLSCRKMASRQRQRLRDKGVQIQVKSNYGAATHTTIIGPTAQALNELAQIYLNNESALETHCYPPLPQDWTPPEGVTYISQYGQPWWLLCSTALMERPSTKAAMTTPERPKSLLPFRPEDVLNRNL